MQARGVGAQFEHVPEHGEATDGAGPAGQRLERRAHGLGIRVVAVHQQRGAGDCGPVDILLLDSRHANVRISDIVYRLELDRGQIDVILMHGTMQIDGFTARYAWQGKTLNFSDPEKGLQYQIHFDASKAHRPR
jgi:hypothetical protein